MLARITTTSARRIPRVAPIAIRFYSEPSGFSKKEKAHEDQYAREKERQELEKLRDQIAKKKAELAELEKKQSEKSS